MGSLRAKKVQLCDIGGSGALVALVQYLGVAVVPDGMLAVPQSPARVLVLLLVSAVRWCFAACFRGVSAVREAKGLRVSLKGVLRFFPCSGGGLRTKSPTMIRWLGTTTEKGVLKK